MFSNEELIILTNNIQKIEKNNIELEYQIKVAKKVRDEKNKYNALKEELIGLQNNPYVKEVL